MRNYYLNFLKNKKKIQYDWLLILKLPCRFCSFKAQNLTEFFLLFFVATIENREKLCIRVCFTIFMRKISYHK